MILIYLKYILGAIVSIPLLPIMYVQSKKVRAQIPDLPEASGPSGEYIHMTSDKDQISLLTIGESTIAGVGVTTHEEGFTGTLATSIGNHIDQSVSWQVHAKSGYTAKMVTKEILPLIPEKSPDLIVVGLGANDAFKLNTPWGWKRDAKILIAAIKKKFPVSPIFFCDMPPVKDFPAFTPLIKLIIGNLIELLGDTLQVVTNDLEQVYFYNKRVKLEDWETEDTPRPVFFSDGVHPSKLTYQLLARDLAKEIQESKFNEQYA